MKKKEKHVVTIVVGPIFGRARARPVPPGLLWCHCNPAQSAACSSAPHWRHRHGACWTARQPLGFSSAQDTSVKYASKPKTENSSDLLRDVRNYAGISVLFFLTVPTNVMFCCNNSLARGTSLVKYLSVVILRPDPLSNILGWIVTLFSYVYRQVAGVSILSITAKPPHQVVLGGLGCLVHMLYKMTTES